MRKPGLFKLKENSLFFKLLISFLLLSVCLISFNFLSLSFFKNKIQTEIIDQNNENIQRTAENYENHLQLVDNLLTGLYFEPTTEILKDQELDPSKFQLVNQMTDHIKSLMSNPYLYLDNILFYFKDRNYILDKNGISSPEQMFNQYYISSEYDAKFWENKFTENFHLKMYPAAAFRVMPGGDMEKTETYFPIIVKNKIENRVLIIALLNASQTFDRFHSGSNDLFHIIDGSTNTTLFASDFPNADRAIDSRFEQPVGYTKLDDNYYFFRNSPDTGIRYLSLIPNKKISDEVFKFYFVMIVIFIISIMVSIGISIFLSMRFYSPIQKIIKSVQELNKDITRKNSMLVNYGYIDKLKKLGNNNREIEELIHSEKPFYMVLFQLTLTREFKHLHTIEEHFVASKFIREFIRANINADFKETATIPVEKDQVITLIFDSCDVGYVLNVLQQIKQFFDRDREQCFLTISFDPVLVESLQYGEAYDRSVLMARQRKLNGDTQIITELKSEYIVLLLPPEQERVLAANLLAGNSANSIHLVHKLLADMEKKAFAGYQFRQFAEEVISSVFKTLSAQNVQLTALLDPRSPYQEILEFTGTDEYIEFFGRFLTQAAKMLSVKRAEKDLIDAITDYMAEHYGSDLSLDFIADKFKLSSGYLSIYFKDKKGMNFSTYLNELRANKAIELLRETGLKIHEIANEVGYQNVNSFIRMFKKMNGLSPNEFRRKQALPETESLS